MIVNIVLAVCMLVGGDWIDIGFGGGVCVVYVVVEVDWSKKGCYVVVCVLVMCLCVFSVCVVGVW